MSAPERQRPEIVAAVKIAPVKRRATYAVPLESEPARPRTLSADVQATRVTLTSTRPSGYDGRFLRDSLTVPRTLEAVDAAIALLEAVRAELVEQGVDK